MRYEKDNIPIKILTLDTETYNGLQGELKRIAIYDGNPNLEPIYGYKFNDILPHILKWDETHQVHIWIHNAEFDLRKIPQIFYGSNVIWEKSMIISGKIAKLTCKHYTIHDSFKILPSSLAKLSKSFNVDCGKLDLWEAVEETYPNQYTNIVDYLDRCDIDDPLYLKYLGYDVISLYQVMENARESFGLSEKEWVKILSTASLARHIFKHGFKGQKFKNKGQQKSDFQIMCQMKWHLDDEQSESLTPLEVETIIREGYVGGRTEVFKPVLNHNGNHYDVNSLYPSQYFKDYPVGNYTFYDDSKIIESRFCEWLHRKSGLGFLTVEVYIPQQHIPPLPVRKGKLMFPTGYIRGTWTYVELEYAMNHCGVEIIEYYEMIHFENTFPVFKNLVEVFAPLKEKATREGDLAMREVSKLIMNTSYGYTGMRRDDKTTLVSLMDLDDENYYTDPKTGEKILALVNEEFGYAEIPTEVKAEYIQVQIASYVTSYARLVLLDALRKADTKGEVYYCDTDSIVTDVALPSEIVDSSKLGFWDLESEPEKAIFLRPKVYSEIQSTGKIVKKFKGISRETVQSWEYSKYEMLLSELQKKEKDAIVLEEDKLVLPSIMVMLKNHRDLSETDFRTKKMNLLNKEKRQIDYVKNKTVPWHFHSIEEFDAFDFLKHPTNYTLDLTKKY